jgi:hypothetical protein
VVDTRAICEVCGHTRQWHDRVGARPLLAAEPGIERPCYREVGGAACRCGGFRESGEIAVSRVVPRAPRDAVHGAQVVALVLVLVVFGLLLLYAYRSQTPNVITVPMTAAIQDVQAGRVRSVTIVDSAATLELANGSRERTTVAQPDEVFAKAILDYNATSPAQKVDLRYVKEDQTLPVIGGILLSLLPFALIVVLLFLMLRAGRGS